MADIDLAVGRGEFLAVTGRSGCGKSTLLKVLGLIDPPDRGTLRIVGVALDRVDERERARLRRTHIGFIFQAFNLIGELNALENVSFALALAGVGRAERLERAAAMLEHVGLGDRLRHFPAQLSGGQQQRVAIARALVTEPDLILADEPTGNLDQTSGQQVLDLLQGAHAKGASIVLVTHESAYAALAERRLVMVDGRFEDTVGA